MEREELEKMRKRARTEGWTTAARNMWREGGRSTSGRGVDEMEMEEGNIDGGCLTSDETRYRTAVSWEEEIGGTSTPR